MEVRKANKRARNDSVTTEAGKRARKESETVEDSAIAPEIISAALNAPGIENVKKAKDIDATSEEMSNNTVATLEAAPAEAPKKGKKRKEKESDISASTPENKIAAEARMAHCCHMVRRRG